MKAVTQINSARRRKRRGSLRALALMGLVVATLAGAATEPYDGLIAQAWTALGGSPRSAGSP